jgi:dTDP-4-dehydrorhamnose 3,5-epimerase
MRLRATTIEGVTLIENEPDVDERGWFARTYCAETFRANAVPFTGIRQTSVSYNAMRATLRGMHWQAQPAPEAKLVRAAAGRIFDVVIDLRSQSSTFRRWIGVELGRERYDALVVPAGCAHGFLTLDDGSIVEYAMDADYRPDLARGVRWDDPAFAVEWPLPPQLMSARDRSWPDFRP